MLLVWFEENIQLRYALTQNNIQAYSVVAYTQKSGLPRRADRNDIAIISDYLRVAGVKLGATGVALITSLDSEAITLCTSQASI